MDVGNIALLEQEIIVLDRRPESGDLKPGQVGMFEDGLYWSTNGSNIIWMKGNLIKGRMMKHGVKTEIVQDGGKYW